MELNDECINLLNSLTDGVYIVDTNRNIIFWNTAAEKLTGYLSNEVVGRCCANNILRHLSLEGEEICKGGCPLHHTIEDKKPRQLIAYLHHKKGYRVPVCIKTSPLLDKNGKISQVLETFSQNTKEWELQDKVYHLNEKVNHDILTGLHTRDYIIRKMRTFVFEKKEVGVIFIDLDDFKQVNDQFGHEMGDKALAMAARSIENSLRDKDFIGRWGGEEFVAIIPSISKKVLIRLSERIRVLVASSWLDAPSNEKIQLTVSIGATLTNIEDTPDSAIRRADQLMYKSKKDGKNKSYYG